MQALLGLRVIPIRIAQGAQLAFRDGFGQHEQVSPQQVDVLEAQGREPRHRRTLATNRSRTLAPGSSTLYESNQSVARSNRTPGRSVPVQHRPYSQRAKRKPTYRSAKSR